MSRAIAGTASWDTASWGAGGVDTPYGSTWSGATQSTDLATAVDTEPASWGVATWGTDVWSDGNGALVGPNAVGLLRFVVQILDPTLAIDSQWGVATWDTSLWSQSVGKWSDLSSRVRGVHWEQGSDEPGEQERTATAAVTLNNTDGDASPWATSGDFHGPGARPWLRAGVLVRFGVVCNDVAAVFAATGLTLQTFNAFFTGRVDTIDEDTESNADAWVVLNLVECTADLAVVPQTSQVVQGVDGHVLTEALWEVLEAADYEFQTSMTVPDDDVLTGGTTLVFDEMSSLERLRNLAGNRFWNVVTEGTGRIRMVERHADSLDSGVTFTNDVSAADEYPFEDAKPYAGSDRIANALSATRQAGDTSAATLQLVEDLASMRQFGEVTDRYGFPRSDLIVRTDADVLWLLHHVIGLVAWDDLGIASIALDADMDEVNLPAVMAFVAAYARYGYSFNVRWVHPSGNVYRERVVVEGMTHDFIPEGSQLMWTSELRFGHAGQVGGS